MSKCVVEVGYTKYVLEAQEAVVFCELLCKAERYEDKYHSAEGGKESYYTHHVWEDETKDKVIHFTLLPDGFYKIAKMAGKPEGRT